MKNLADQSLHSESFLRIFKSAGSVNQNQIAKNLTEMRTQSTIDLETLTHYLSSIQELFESISNYQTEEIGLPIDRAFIKSKFFSTNKMKSCSNDEFTSREIEILIYICQELSTKEIAERLFISQRTVEGLRTKLLQKTCSRNTAGLVIFAVKNNLITF